MEERIKKWRMILGQTADPQGEAALEGEDAGIDQVLEALYDQDRQGGLGDAAPDVNRWLGDIRRYFPSPLVRIMQRDALERLGLEEMLLEPELLDALEPDPHLVGMILNLQSAMPEKTRITARDLVRRLARDVEARLRNPLREAIRGSLNRAQRNRHPKLRDIDWNRTILKNLKNYQPQYRAVIPERLIGYGRRRQMLKKVILLVDQSGSMTGSVVYAGILGSIIASLQAVRTHLVAFSTSLVDLSDKLEDPTELLFATQLGGGTDINRAVAYGQGLIQQPRDSIVVLISDLFEGGRPEELLERVAAIQASGAQFISLLALDDEGAPAFDRRIAGRLARLDIPSFACTPEQFPRLIASAINREDIYQWAAREKVHLHL